MSTFIGMGVSKDSTTENKDLKKLVKEKQTLEKEVEALTSENTELVNKIDDLEKEVEALTAQNVRLTEKKTAKKTETDNE